MTNKEKKYLNKLSFYEADKATLEVDDLHELKQKIADDTQSGEIIKEFLNKIKTDVSGGGDKEKYEHTGGIKL